jgi:hypothetical protein
MVQLSIDEEVMDYIYKKSLLENEIYKLVFIRCKNVNINIGILAGILIKNYINIQVQNHFFKLNFSRI